eukprot:CAMPEP_0202957592 /NCGR_PEP_ID=MMETSP1396-20130829/1960_1 /ASSEMBLY_ACC=CAM_ASM_000872 /TAXON_ID= /ORGANISM="Pseudokeronopsis sp., Strain Brazil" /LENGTH=79 /DNA_ID=CAMNT_0049675147 /DNA_START=184 /DNA_END=420 /DNA_ORIENTATION=-
MLPVIAYYTLLEKQFLLEKEAWEWFGSYRIDYLAFKEIDDWGRLSVELHEDQGADPNTKKVAIDFELGELKLDTNILVW